MKTTKFIALVMLLGSAALANNSVLDSLRQTVLAPKILAYDAQVEKYSALIRSAQSKAEVKQHARELVQASNALENEIRELYGYKDVAVTKGVYVGKGVQTFGYTNVGGYIYPTTYTTVGHLPAVFNLVDRIRSYASRIRLISQGAGISKNLQRIAQEAAALKTV